MKIGIIGSVGVGKTRIADKIRDDFKIIGTPVVVLDAISEVSNSKVDKENFEQVTIWRCLEQVLREEEMCEKVDTVVCDITPIDGFMIARAFNVGSRLIDVHFDFAERWMDTYDTIVYVTAGHCTYSDQGLSQDKKRIIAQIQDEFTSWIYSKSFNFNLTLISSDDL